MCPVEYRPDGSLELITGSSRTGKTALALQETRRARPLLVWDPEGQWSAMGATRPIELAELLELTRSGLFKQARLSYIAAPSLKEFDRFCSIAWAWIRLHADTTILVEELSDVTHPGKAPPAWGVIIRRGLKYGARIIAITQSPVESDKTVVRNAGRVVAFGQERLDDRAYMARALDVPLSELELEPLHYVERRRGVGITRGRVSFGKLRKSTPRRARRAR